MALGVAAATFASVGSGLGNLVTPELTISNAVIIPTSNNNLGIPSNSESAHASFISLYNDS